MLKKLLAGPNQLLSIETEPIKFISSKVMIQANLLACFSEVKITVDITFNSDQFPRVVAIRNGETIFDGQLSSQMVAAFVDEVFRAAAKPERVTGARITTHYTARLDWKNYEIQGFGDSGHLEFAGRDLPEEVHREYFHLLQGETAQRIKELLEVGLHCRPMAIFSIAHTFLKNLGDKSQSSG